MNISRRVNDSGLLALSADERSAEVERNVIEKHRRSQASEYMANDGRPSSVARGLDLVVAVAAAVLGLLRR